MLERIRGLVVILAAALVMNAGAAAAHRSMLQRGIAEEVLRFHVLANSDSAHDQSLKYMVRDTLLAWMQETENETENEKNKMQGSRRNRLQTEAYLASHLREAEAAADRVLEAQGAAYRAKASVETCYFPERTYGALTFPAGWYRALRVRLGAAKGHNWWCILYPGLCFSDCLHASADQSAKRTAGDVNADQPAKRTAGNVNSDQPAKRTAGNAEAADEELRSLLTAEEYESLLHSPKQWKIAFRWF